MHLTGTDRLAEVASSLDCDVIVNVQGDEPLLDPRAISELVSPFSDKSVSMSTLYRRITDPSELSNPNVVKLVTDRAGFAMYFSRAPIPHTRDPRGGYPPLFRHVGVYAYRRTALMVLASLEPTPLERAESLEQLRALEHGIRIRAVETKYDSIGVDTPDDSRTRAPTARRPAIARTDGAHHTLRNSHMTATKATEVHLRHRRRGLVARQGAGGRVDSARCSRGTATRSRCRSSIPTSTSTLAR
ncbi:MAG: 3-deoxy-manno-octulosonate cytidylyltransferase [Vicinamibacterales bacterium]